MNCLSFLCKQPIDKGALELAAWRSSHVPSEQRLTWCYGDSGEGGGGNEWHDPLLLFYSFSIYSLLRSFFFLTTPFFLECARFATWSHTEVLQFFLGAWLAYIRHPKFELQSWRCLGYELRDWGFFVCLIFGGWTQIVKVRWIGWLVLLRNIISERFKFCQRH